MTFDEMVALDPRLGLLRDDARAAGKRYGRNAERCANAVWYGYGGFEPGFKPRLKRLVGWFAENAALDSPDCYDVAYQTLYDLMPTCRGSAICGCL